MRRHSRFAPFAYIAALVASVALVAAAARAVQQRAAAAAGHVALAKRFEESVNAADARLASELTVAGVRNDYAWITEWKRSGGNTRPWRASVFSPMAAANAPTDALLEISRPQLCESTSDHLYALQRTASGWRIGNEIPETDHTAYRIRSHKVSVVFDRAGRRATIDNTVTMDRTRSTSAGPIVRLNCYYRVREVQLGGRPHAFTQSGGFIALAPFDGPTADLRFLYGAPLPPTGESFVRSDEAALTAYWYPHIARLPVTSDITITGPATWKCIGPGKFIAQRDGAGVSSWRWQNHVPVCFITVAGGAYHESARKASAATAKVWLLDRNEERAAGTLDVAARALDWFSARFGPYPYPEFTVVESRVFPPALEGYSFTLAGSGSIPWAVSHEISHTWWGGLVPNTYTRSMWNESLATYTDGMFGRAGGTEDAPAAGRGAHASAASLPTSVSLLRATDAMHPEHSAIGYGKGAMVMEQLERMIGTEKVVASLRSFVARHRSGDDAEWSDIADAVARVAGSEWRSFFPSWLERAEVPRFALQDVQASRAQDGYVVNGAVSQSKPAFWSAAELVVSTEDGGSQSLVIPVRSERAPFTLKTRQRPLTVVLDPKGEMLRTGPLEVSVAIASKPDAHP